MSSGAETLRRAAALMRERAGAVGTRGCPWDGDTNVYDSDAQWVADTLSDTHATHIASWHPAVALAVADWLDAEAAKYAEVEALLGPPVEGASSPSLTVARAYLGETS